MWEEPVISGSSGSGTIFFSGCCLGCVFCFAISFIGGEANMLGFPVLFFLAAVMNFFTAWLRLRRDIRGRNQLPGGILSLAGGLILLVLSYVAVLNLW